MSGGGFVIANESYNSTTGIFSSVMTVYDASGNEILEISIGAGATDTVSEPQVFAVGSGFWVTYFDPSTATVMAKVYDASNALTNTFQVNVDSASAAAAPQGVELDNGNVVIVWENSGQTTFQIINGSTLLPVGAADFDVDGDIWGLPKIVAGPDGGFVIAYNDYAGSFPGNASDPKAFVFDNAGNQFGDVIWLSKFVEADQTAVEIVALDSGEGFLAIWFDEFKDAYITQAYDWFGNALSGATPFAFDIGGSIAGGSSTEQISATLLDDGRIAVTFQTGGLDGDTAGVAMTILDPRDGVVFGSTANETLYGSSQSDIIYTGGGDDVVLAGAGNDFIYDAEESTVYDTEAYGGAGDDFMSLGGGADLAWGERGNDTIFGGSGVDEIYGGNDDDYINAGDGDDLLVRGNNGSDTIDGGDGRDFLGGGPAADTFVFSDVAHSVVGGFRDRIVDFEQGIDVIDLSKIDAVTGGTDDAFVLIGTAAFSGTAGEIRYLQTATKTIFNADVDGDGIEDFSFELSGLYDLTDADFIL